MRFQKDFGKVKEFVEEVRRAEKAIRDDMGRLKRRMKASLLKHETFS